MKVLLSSRVVFVLEWCLMLMPVPTLMWTLMLTLMWKLMWKLTCWQKVTRRRVLRVWKI